jgi:ATP-binding cassette subfamily C (CFTR/MRP) protein 1
VYLKCLVLALGVSSLVLECLGLENPEQGENPILTASIYSRWFFSYMTPLMKKGASQYITEEDLPPMVQEDTCGKLGDALIKAQSKQCVLAVFLVRTAITLQTFYFLRSKSLWRALAAAYGGPYLVAAFLKIAQDCLAFLQPQLLRILLAYISSYQDARRIGHDPDPGAVQGFVIAAIMFIAAAIQSILIGQARLNRHLYGPQEF